MLLAIAVGVAGCSSANSTDGSDRSSNRDATTVSPVPDATVVTDVADTAGGPRASPATSTGVATTTDTTTPPASTPAPTTAIETTSTSLQRRTTTTAPLPATTPYLVPLADPGAAGWGEGHSGYPATDIFANCGAGIVSPLSGVLAEMRTVDSWDWNVDNPATRGGRSVTIIGDDGVRYYLAHLDDVDGRLAVGDRVTAGTRLGTVGLTGRTSGCHVHFGISPPCPGKEWSIRRGAIPPKPYLDAWRAGRRASPPGEVLRWASDNPRACEQAMNDPFAEDA